MSLTVAERSFCGLNQVYIKFCFLLFLVDATKVGNIAIHFNITVKLPYSQNRASTLAVLKLCPLHHGADPIQAALFLISDHLSVESNMETPPTPQAALKLLAQNTMFKPEIFFVMNAIRN